MKIISTNLIGPKKRLGFPKLVKRPAAQSHGVWKDREERSRGVETLITESLDKIKPTEPFRLDKKTVKISKLILSLRVTPDSDSSLVRADTS
jgi:hypothetical protein